MNFSDENHALAGFTSQGTQEEVQAPIDYRRRLFANLPLSDDRRGHLWNGRSPGHQKHSKSFFIRQVRQGGDREKTLFTKEVEFSSIRKGRALATLSLNNFIERPDG